MDVVQQRDRSSNALLDLVANAAGELHTSHRQDSGPPFFLHIEEEMLRHWTIEGHGHLGARSLCV
jgi:hypothetical protein